MKRCKSFSVVFFLLNSFFSFPIYHLVGRNFLTQGTVLVNFLQGPPLDDSTLEEMFKTYGEIKAYREYAKDPER